MATDTPAIAVEVSENRKLGTMSTTYVSQASCPSDCPFRGSGCYAESGSARFTTSRLNRCQTTDIDLIAAAEAAAIRKLKGTLPLRLHVVGDAPTESAARTVADAAMNHTRKHGQPSYTYTHAWRVVPREAWGTVSVLASCETMADVAHAHSRGYAAAIVVPEFQTDKAYRKDGYTVIPCPQQTRGLTCSECRLCMAADKLHASKRVIGFAAHGSRSGAVKKVLGG